MQGPIRSLLERGADVNAKGPFGTPLTSAIRKHYDTCLDLDRGPSHYGAGAEAAEVVGTLIACGADVNVPEDNGDTPLIVAARCGSRELAEVLLTHGADVTARGRYGTAVQTARRFTQPRREQDYQEVIRLLLAHGAEDLEPDRDLSEADQDLAHGREGVQ